MPALTNISSVVTLVLGLIIRSLLKVTGVRVTVNGIERVPEKSVIFVSNHYTRLETVLLPYLIKRRLGITPRTLTARYVF